MPLLRNAGLDIDEYQLFHRRFGVAIHKLSPGAFNGHNTIVHLDGMALIRCGVNPSILVSSSVGDEVGFLFPLRPYPVYAAGRIHSWESQIVTAGNADIQLIHPPGSDQLLIAISRPLLLQVLGPGVAEHFTAMAKEVEHHPRCCMQKPTVTARLLNWFESLVFQLEKGAAVDKDGFIAKVLRQLYEYLQQICANPRQRDGNHARIMKASLRYILTHPARKVNAEALIEEVHASKRTIHNVFGRIIDTSPIHFIKLIRLNELRQELLQCDDEQQVRLLFAYYGFTNPSRAAREYEELFGEKPAVRRPATYALA